MDTHPIHTKGNDPLYILILWHMHQPIYRRVNDSDYLLPWVRLHAIKDYFDMVSMLENFPGVRLTFNLVPSLIEQIADYAQHGADDSFLVISRKAAADLTLEERLFLLKNFFSLNFDQMIQPYPRYKELLEKRGHVGDMENIRSKATQFSVQDFLDLQVWFNLSWCGASLRQHPDINALLWKGRNFSEEDKKNLFDLQQQFMARIIPAYRQARERGQIEISVSPYYHAILPLLCNINSAREALPNIELPKHDFHHPEDVRWHVQRAIRCYEQQFGEKPKGMWPSEGAISEETLAILREADICWVATDEEILQTSLRRCAQLAEGHAFTPEKKYIPYNFKTPTGPIKIFFRDHLLSDMIGFTYSTYDGEAAAEDLVSRLLLVRKMLPDDGRYYAVPIILDGENAWEYYPENGVHFLQALYSRLQASQFLKTATFSEFLQSNQELPDLAKVRAGSWIYGTFSTWVGHPEKNRAWDLLATTRKKVEEMALTSEGNPEKKEMLRKAHHEVMIAEGSDWFWWYGEDHFSEYDREFDQLFREHLQAAWRYIEMEPPAELFAPIIQKVSRFKIQRPFELLTPVLDGLITDYFEWLAAGYFSNQYLFTTMQQVHRIFSGFHFGFDHDNFYIRLDVDQTILNDKKYPFTVEIIFRKPHDIVFRMVKDNIHDAIFYYKVRLGDNGAEVESTPVPLAGVKQIVELGVPFAEIGIHENQALEFALKIFIGDNLAERMPHTGYLSQKIAIDDLEKYYWVV